MNKLELNKKKTYIYIIYINNVTVRVHVCHTFQYNLTKFESSDSLYVSYAYTNGATLPVSQQEQDGASLQVLKPDLA